jgi:hypothetical protein
MAKDLTKTEADKVLAELKETGTVPTGYAVDWFANPVVSRVETMAVAPDAEPPMNTTVEVKTDEAPAT